METRVKVQRSCQQTEIVQGGIPIGWWPWGVFSEGTSNPCFKGPRRGRDVGRDGGRGVPRAWKES